MGDIVKTIFGLILAVVVLWIVWNIVMYFSELESQEGKREYKPMIINGVSLLLLLMLLYAVVEWIRAQTGL